MTANGAAARMVNGWKVYGSGDAKVTALAGINESFARGEFSAIMGPSGSGKSTLLHCIAGLDELSDGEVYIGDVSLGDLKDKALTELRRERVGFVFQAFNLVPTMSARENILLPLSLAGKDPDQEWFERVVTTVGLEDRLTHRPSELSGGQQQRVAAARALVSKPDIVFADEPSGNLDSNSSGELLTFMRQAVDELGQTIVMVTHDPNAASYSDRIVFLQDGAVIHELRDPTADKVLDSMRQLDG